MNKKTTTNQINPATQAKIEDLVSLLKEILLYGDMDKRFKGEKRLQEYLAKTKLEYEQLFDAFNAFLLDLTLVMLCFKKEDPQNTFFRNESSKQWKAVLKEFPDATKDERDCFELEKFIYSSKIQGLEYKENIYIGTSYNFFLDCWKALFFIGPTMTDIKTLSLKHTRFSDAFKDVVNAIYLSSKIESFGCIVEHIISEATRMLARKKRGFFRYPTISQMELVESLVENKTNKNICIEPSLLEKTQSTNTKVSFIFSEWMTNIKDMFNLDFIRAYAHGIDIQTIVTYDENFSDRSLGLNTATGVENPILVFSGPTLIEKTNIRYDIIALEPEPDFNLNGSAPKKNNELAVKNTINQIDNFFKLLNPKGKVVLFIDNRSVRKYKINTPLFDKVNRIMELDDNLMALVFEKDKSDKLILFNGSKINLSGVKKRFNIRLNDYGYKNLEILNEAREAYRKELLNLKSPLWLQIDRKTWKNDNYTFSVSRYFMPVFPGEPIKNFVKYIPGEKSDFKNGDRTIGISQLNSHPGELTIVKKTNETTTSKIPTTVINKECLLIAMKGDSLKPTKFTYAGRPIFLKPGVVALDLDESKISFDFLMYALDSKEVKEQLKYIAFGRTISYYRFDDLINIRIKIPENKSEQEAKILERKENIIERLKLKDLVDSIKLDQYTKLRHLRHTMGDYLSNIQSNISLALGKINQTTDQEINKKLEINSFDIIRRLKSLEKDFASLRDLTSRFKQGLEFDEKHYPLVTKSIKDINELTSKILEQNEKNSFVSSVELMGDDFSTNEEKLKDYRNLGLKINAKAYKVFITNFIINTEKHSGFEEANKEKNKLKIVFLLDKGKINLIIKNNGNPFKKDFNKQDFVTAGYTTNQIEGDGLGGNQIEAIANLFKIEDWSLINEPNDKYPVQFKFIITLIPLD